VANALSRALRALLFFAPEHDPEKWYRFSEKIMLKQKDGTGMMNREKSSRSYTEKNLPR
jgi:hypothetical protein